jgi:hypothetical protein
MRAEMLSGGANSICMINLIALLQPRGILRINGTTGFTGDRCVLLESLPHSCQSPPQSSLGYCVRSEPLPHSISPAAQYLSRPQHRRSGLARWIGNFSFTRGEKALRVELPTLAILCLSLIHSYHIRRLDLHPYWAPPATPIGMRLSVGCPMVIHRPAHSSWGWIWPSFVTALRFHWSPDVTDVSQVSV